ncbi:MAG TPA: hypothetical protein P5149_15810, partial [Candidatus Competibacteraceae bacterium]|nr:hypothetical protein [Candidatus Competibacteraceae bacterium]
ALIIARKQDPCINDAVPQPVSMKLVHRDEIQSTSFLGRAALSIPQPGNRQLIGEPALGHFISGRMLFQAMENRVLCHTQANCSFVRLPPI